MHCVVGIHKPNILTRGMRQATVSGCSLTGIWPGKTLHVGMGRGIPFANIKSATIRAVVNQQNSQKHES
jgi:hypothetical protein